MAQELEISNIYEFEGTEKNSGDAERSERQRLRIWILTLGVLCITQAALNISLRLAMYSKEYRDPTPFNSSIIADWCQNEQSLQNSTQLCSCCNKLLRKVLKEYEALKRERACLQAQIIQLTTDDDSFQDSGSGL